MPLPPHLAITMRFMHFSAEHNCILYYTKTQGPGPDVDGIEQEADWFDTALRPKVRACINPDVQWLGVKARYITLDQDLEAYSSDDPAPGVAVSDDVEPEEVAVVIQRRTSLPGRNKRGRIFMPYVPSDFLEGSGLNQLGRDSYGDLATRIGEVQVNNQTANTWTPVQPDWKGGTLIPITHVRIDSEVKSRRDRRAPKRSVILNP